MKPTALTTQRACKLFSSLLVLTTKGQPKIARYLRKFVHELEERVERIPGNIEMIQETDVCVCVCVCVPSELLEKRVGS